MSRGMSRARDVAQAALDAARHRLLDARRAAGNVADAGAWRVSGAERAADAAAWAVRAVEQDVRWYRDIELNAGGDESRQEWQVAQFRKYLRGEV